MSEREFTMHVEWYRPKLEAFARSFTRETWEDLLQESLLKAWRFRQKFEPGTSFDSWLFMIIRNTYINEYRRTKNRGYHDSYSDEDHAYLLNQTSLAVYQPALGDFDD